MKLLLLFCATVLTAAELPRSPHVDFRTRCRASVALSHDGSQIALSSADRVSLGKTDNLDSLSSYSFDSIPFAADKLLFDESGTTLLGAAQDLLFVAQVRGKSLKPYSWFYQYRLREDLLAFRHNTIYAPLNWDDPRWDTGCLPDTRPLLTFNLKRGTIQPKDTLTSFEGCHHLKRFSVTKKNRVYIAKDDPDNICRTFIYKKGKKEQLPSPEHFRMESSVGDLGIFSDFKERTYRYGLFVDIHKAEQFPELKRPKEIAQVKSFTATPDETAVIIHARDQNGYESIWIAEVKNNSVGEFYRILELRKNENLHALSVSNTRVAVITTEDLEQRLYFAGESLWQKVARCIVTQSLTVDAPYEEIVLDHL